MSEYRYGSASMGGAGGGGGGQQDNAAIMERVKAELAIAEAKEIVQKVGSKCFAKCVIDPSYDLGSKEQRCVSNCVDRYLEAWNVVSTHYNKKLHEGSH